MPIRALVLLLLLTIRIVIGLLWVSLFTKNSEVRVSGNIVKVIQTNSNCIVELPMFVVLVAGRCNYKIGSLVSFFGKQRWQLIEAIKGKIVIDDAVFDYPSKSYLAAMSLSQEIGLGEQLRNYCSSIYKKYLPNKEAALLAGIVLGDKSNIGQDFYQQMVKSGTIHIAVASGYNLMLVGGTTLTLLFWLFKRRGATAGAVVVMVGYGVLAGLGAPVIRALLMSSLVYGAALLGRRASSGWLLLLSVWVMLIWDVGFLGSVSFQLSVAASVGLMVVSPWITEKLVEKGWEWEVVLGEKLGVITTVSTMLVTAPIIWWHFGRVSLIGLFSNIFVLPLVPPAMTLGVFTLVAPRLFFVPTYGLLHLMVRIIGFFGS